MKNIFSKSIKTLLVVLVASITTAFIETAPTVNYKCMIQMANYTGEKAYVAVSLINPEGAYVRTLYIQGDDREWFPDLPQWWGFSHGSNENVDAITGATIGNGQRNIIAIALNASELDAGYVLRFESAVENKEYYATDAEVALETASLRNKVDGKGYIRYVRMVPN